jgi:hypothetical protein
MIDCIHYQITMMKLLLFTMIFVGFEIQDNLAMSEMTNMNIRKDCWDMNKCLLDKHCGQNGQCLMDPHLREG